VCKWFTVIHAEEKPMIGPMINEIPSKPFYDELKITNLPVKT
jgi:hypothetical protein